MPDWIYNIPICGGFCAPTESPERSWLRHFSNEYTVPASGVFMKLSGCLETNRCCRRCGRTGNQWGRDHRRGVMLTAFTVSFVAWLLTIYGAGAVSMNRNILKRCSWVYGSLWHHPTGTRLDVAIGLKGRIDTIDCRQSATPYMCQEALNHTRFEEIEQGVWERVIRWSESTSCMSEAKLKRKVKSIWEFLGSDSFDGKVCHLCRDTASASVGFVIMGVITQIPQMTTDLQRATRFGDVNCQASMGAITSFFGTYSTLASLYTFSQFCWKSFPAKAQWLLPYSYSWKPGPALICLVIATLLKLWDAFSHVLVPTPRARQVKPTPGLDLVQYMMLAEDHPGPSSEEMSESEYSDDYFKE